MRNGIDLALVVLGRAERRAVVEVRAAIPRAVPGVRFDRGPQRLGPISAPGGLRLVGTAVGDFGERVQYGDEKPTVPDAFALAVRADLVHAVVPIAGAHQGQAVGPELVAVLQGAHAVLVDTAHLLAHARNIVVVFLIRPQHRGFQERHVLVEQREVAGRGDIVVDGKGKEVQVVSDAGSDTGVGGRMPPVLHVALFELARR